VNNDEISSMDEIQIQEISLREQGVHDEHRRV
jgi:hypothetical protein